MRRVSEGEKDLSLLVITSYSSSLQSVAAVGDVTLKLGTLVRR